MKKLICILILLAVGVFCYERDHEKVFVDYGVYNSASISSRASDRVYSKLGSNAGGERNSGIAGDVSSGVSSRDYNISLTVYEERKAVNRRSHDRVTSRGEDRPQKTLLVEATAYILTKNPTATGTRTGIGTIAVDPKVIPLGTRLYVEGYGWGTALDTGADIKGHRIDVWLPTYDQAMNWGRRKVRVHVYGGNES